MDKMRDEFEAWYSDFDGYGDAHKQELWETWKASRAALCVELPDNLDGEYYADGWNACLIAVGEKIEESGVSYK